MEIGSWTTGAVIVVGLMQWLKTFAPNVNKKQWGKLLPVMALLSAYLKVQVTGQYQSLGWDWAGIWAVSQLGYDLIVQAIRKKIVDK